MRTKAQINNEITSTQAAITGYDRLLKECGTTLTTTELLKTVEGLAAVRIKLRTLRWVLYTD